MKTLTTEELRNRLESGPVALFDVRGDVEFEKGHIPGAKTAPLGSLVFRIARVMNPDSFVAVYAHNRGDQSGTGAVERLTDLGLTNVHLYADGIEGWERAGGSVIASSHAKLHTQGPVQDCRPLIVDRERAYGGAFRDINMSVEGAGG